MSNLDDIDQFIEAVRSTAFLLWDEAGRPEGRSDEFWYRALDIHRRSQSPVDRSSSQQGAAVDGDTPPGNLEGAEALSLAIETERQRDA